MIVRRGLGAAIFCATLAPFHVCVAQQIDAIHLVAAMIPLAEGVRSYCDSVSPGTGAAIADAVAFRREWKGPVWNRRVSNRVCRAKA
jgi:hypothetical protein